MRCKRKVIYLNQTMHHPLCILKSHERRWIVNRTTDWKYFGTWTHWSNKRPNRTWCDHMPSFRSLLSQRNWMGVFGERPICHTNFPFYWSLNRTHSRRTYPESHNTIISMYGTNANVAHTYSNNNKKKCGPKTIRADGPTSRHLANPFLSSFHHRTGDSRQPACLLTNCQYGVICGKSLNSSWHIESQPNEM